MRENVAKNFAKTQRAWQALSDRLQ